MPPAASQPALMRRALSLAARGRGRVEPNPMVGCVIARGDRILAEGWHRRFGGPHAEVDALECCRAAGHDPAGADVYVSLEPCCHHGKTPPCVDALVAAHVGRVFAAMPDPNPQVAGRGAQRLREAGVDVAVGLCEAEARKLNAPFIKRMTSGLPWVVAKWAQTIDGRIATAAGDSKWISNEQSRRRVHRLRARVDAVIVGIGTVLADDPLLTARDVPIRRTARRVVIDPQLRIPRDAALVRSLSEPAAPPVLIATTQEALQRNAGSQRELEAAGVELFVLQGAHAQSVPAAAHRPTSAGSPGDRADGSPPRALRPLLEHLSARHDATNVLVEGGATLLGHLFAESLIDQLLVFVAPKLLGDPAALPAVAGPPVERIADAAALHLHAIKRVGQDVMLDYRAPQPDL